jgi:hypothetical protein
LNEKKLAEPLCHFVHHRGRALDGSFHQHDPRIALPLQQIDGDIAAVPLESKIETRIAQSQLVQNDVIQKAGHNRIAKAKGVRLVIELHTKT